MPFWIGNLNLKKKKSGWLVLIHRILHVSLVVGVFSFSLPEIIRRGRRLKGSLPPLHGSIACIELIKVRLQHAI